MKVLLTLLGALGVVCSFVLPQSPRPLVEVRCGMPPSACFELRPGQKEDEGTIRRILAGMLMNPLSIDVRNFVCAEVDGKLVGFGQVCHVVSVYCQQCKSNHDPLDILRQSLLYKTLCGHRQNSLGAFIGLSSLRC